MFSRPQLAGRELWGSGLHLVDPNVTAPEPITLAGYDSSNPYDAAWAPDSNVIAVPLTPVLHDDTVRTGTRGLHLIDVESGVRSQITHSGAQPAWSPDGEYIAYTINPLTSGIAITDRSGLLQWMVSEEGYHPRWRPGSRE
jgi:dipeptidyl aminopeptidase/acylaminoacyl peptidase